MRVKSLLIALAFAATAAGAAQTTQASFEQCASGRVCMWGNNDFQWLLGSRAPGYGLWNLYGDANDEMDSWANRSGQNAAAYSGFDGYADCQTFWKGGNDNNVGPWNSDEVSSWRTDRGC